MIFQSLKFKKNCLKWHVNVSRLPFLIAVVISVSFCNSSAGKKDIKEKQKIFISKTGTSYDSAPDSTNSDRIIPINSASSFPYDLNNPD